MIFFCNVCIFNAQLKAQGKNDKPEFFSPVQSQAMDIYKQYIAKHSIVPISGNPDAEQVQKVSNRIIESVINYYQKEKKLKDLEGFHWEISLLDDSKGDAWCLPTGKMIVNTGLLPVSQSEASLAVVISHQIAHVLLFHGDKRLRKILREYMDGKDLRTAYEAKPTETMEFYMMSFGIGDQIGMIPGFSLHDEEEADYLGGMICANAGYDPREAIVFWERLKRMKITGGRPKVMGNHPVTEERIETLRNKMDDLLQYYQKPLKKNKIR